MPLSKIQTTNNQVVPNLGRRNMVINGAMKVAQRGTSSTGLGASDGYFTVDRFKLNFSSTSARFTMTQDSPTDLPGFTKALKLDCTTADTNIGSGEYLILHHILEGQDLQQLKKGTSNAEKFTVSFYVKGNAAASYTLEIEDVDNNRYNAQEFSVTTSWNRVSLTFDGDTTGIFDNDANASIRMNFWLYVGANFTSGTHTDNVWHTTANQRVGDNQTSLADSTDRTFFITGLQMEVGDVATDFEHRSVGEELELCKRYYQKVTVGENDGPIALGTAYNSSQLSVPIPLHPEMRATPTVDVVTGSNYYRFTSNASNTNFDTLALDIATRRTVIVAKGSLSGMTGGNAGYLYTKSTSAYLAFAAEL